MGHYIVQVVAKPGNVDDIDDLVIHNCVRCDIAGRIVKDWKPGNLVIRMQTGQKGYHGSNDDFSFICDEEKKIQQCRYSDADILWHMYVLYILSYSHMYISCKYIWYV